MIEPCIENCPCCGAQQLLGVWLPRRKARIVRAALAGSANPVTIGMSLATLKAHVWQINNLYLAETNWRLRAVRGIGYRVQEVCHGGVGADVLHHRRAIGRPPLPRW